MSRLVVRQRSFWHTPPGVVLVLLVLGLVLWGIFEFGRYRGGFDSREAGRMVAALQGELAALEEQRSTLRARNAVLDRSAQVEQQAYKQLEGAVAGLQDEIQELKEELAFYRGIVSPKDSSKGLKIQDFSISPGSGERRYQFKLVLTQVLNNGTVARGNLQLEVEGSEGGEQKRYTLEQMSDSDTKQGPAFRFKYFQILQGEFLLPDKFQPTKVHLEVKPKGRTHNRLTQAFDWVVGEKS